MSGIQAIASILPSIRCSDCGADVELSLIGEHLCSKQSEHKMLPLRSGANMIRDRGKKWESTQKVVVTSVQAFPVIGFQLLIECHHCALIVMERKGVEFEAISGTI